MDGIPPAWLRRCIRSLSEGWKTTKTQITVAFIVLGTMGCQSDEAADGLGTQLRDSAGIRIVENAEPANGSRLSWRVGPEPSVSIGVLEGEEAHMLFSVTDATRLADGRIVVVNRGTMELRVFDSSGTHVATWGGRGEGPGEFTDLDQVQRFPDDSIVVWGWIPGPFTVFDPQGRFVRTSGRQARALEDPAPVSVTSDGLILASPYAKFYLLDPLAIEIWDAEGKVRSSLGTYPSWEWVDFPDANTRWREKIFGKRLALEGWGELVVASLPDRYEIRAFATDGILARIVRRDHDPRSTTPADVRAYMEKQVSRIPEEMAEIRAGRRKEIEETPVAEFFPAFGNVMSDAVGHLWIEEYEFPGEERSGLLWTVFGADGRVLGFVETPEGLEIYEIGEDYILGKVVSELGVESVQVWPLERLGG